MKQILLIMAMFSLATQLGYSQERTDYKKESENSFVLPVIMTMEN